MPEIWAERNSLPEEDVLSEEKCTAEENARQRKMEGTGRSMLSCKHKIYISQNRLPVLLVILSLVAACSVIFFSGEEAIAHPPAEPVAGISGFSAETKDGSIDLFWTAPQVSEDAFIELAVGTSGTDATVIRLDKSSSSYRFTDGIHGQLYTFTIKVRREDGSSADEQQKNALFLDWSRLPDLPIVSVTTVTGEDPVFTSVESPEGYWGATAAGNDYIPGQLSITAKDAAEVTAAMEIRIRGNMTAHHRKKPYKIKLSQPMDLLQKGESYMDRDREWLLLSCTSDMRTPVGLYVSRLCGLEWQPDYRFVNLILNGDWKGIYLLIESVKRAESRCNVSESGFIIENDAYWWNESVYFKTENQRQQLGYTFKYPSPLEVREDTIAGIRDYLNSFEELLFRHDPAYAEYIDVTSFANWLLVHDILGSNDGGGTNMYLYKYDFDPACPTSTKIKLGPAWDFDSSYGAKDEWPPVHLDNNLYYEELLTFDDFRDTYRKRWREISATLYADVMEYINELVDTQGDGLWDSLELENARWERPPMSSDECIDFISDWFSSRIAWMDDAISAYGP